LWKIVRPHPGPLPQEREKLAAARGKIVRFQRRRPQLVSLSPGERAGVRASKTLPPKAQI